MTVADLAEAIQSAPHDVLYPGEGLPKQYSRKTGIMFEGEVLVEFEPRYIEKVKHGVDP